MPSITVTVMLSLPFQLPTHRIPFFLSPFFVWSWNWKAWGTNTYLFAYYSSLLVFPKALPVVNVLLGAK